VTDPRAGVAFGRCTSTEVSDRRPVLLVPLGSTEQHGPHLPLDTDTRIAVAVAEHAAALLPDGLALVAPPVAYGASGEHEGFAGTLSIGQEALEAVVVELGRSAGDAFSLVVLVNGHGGNAEPVARAVARLAGEGRRVIAWWPATQTAGWPADSHAGRTETSLLLAIAPEVVRLERAEPGVTTPLEMVLPELRRGGLAAVTANGVLGDPTGASATEGRALLDTRAAELARLVSGHLDRATPVGAAT